MEDYKKPSIRDEPEHFTVQIGTNDLNSEVSSQTIAESIVDLSNPWKQNQIMQVFLILYLEQTTLF